MTEKINRILMDVSFLETKPNQEMKLKEELGLDSLRMVELMVTLEDAFNLQFDESDLDPAGLEPVKDIYLLMEKYKEIAAYAV